MVGIRVEGKHCPHMRGYPQCEPREAGDVSEGTHPPTPENAQATFDVNASKCRANPIGGLETPNQLKSKLMRKFSTNPGRNVSIMH